MTTDNGLDDDDDDNSTNNNHQHHTRTYQKQQQKLQSHQPPQKTAWGEIGSFWNCSRREKDLMGFVWQQRVGWNPTIVLVLFWF
jgi:hypothetical protein